MIWGDMITLGMGRSAWDNEVISDTMLERTGEEFRRRLNGQMREQGHVAELEFGERPVER